MILRKQTLPLAAFCSIALASLAATSSFCQTADSLTLRRVIGMAIKSSASLNAMGKGLTAAKARTSQAKSAYYPMVSGTASYANLGPVEKLDFPLAVGITTDPASVNDKLVMETLPFQLYPSNNWDFHVGADYVLYDFGKRKKSMDLSAIGEQGAETGTDFSAKNIAYQSIVMFESLINSEQMIQAKNEDISNLKQHLDFVKKRLSTGSATQFDVLRSEVQLSNSQTEATNLDNFLVKQQIDFRQFLGLGETAPVFLKGTFDSSYQDVSSDSLVAEAQKKRTEIEFMDIAIKALQAQLGLTKLDLMPLLTAHVAAGGKNGYVPDLDKILFNWVAGAQLQVPIIDGRRSHYHAVELEARIDSMRIVLKDFLDHIRSDVLKGIADVKSAHQNLVAAKVNVGLASESRRIANLQYEAGAIPNLDLLDAEEKFIQAKFAQLSSEYRYTLSRFALQQATGFDFASLAETGTGK
jgi:outer membrane protein